MRLRQLISLSALAVMAYRSYGKLRQARSVSGASRSGSLASRPGDTGTAASAGGLRSTGQAWPDRGSMSTDGPAVDSPVTLTDEIR